MINFVSCDKSKNKDYCVDSDICYKTIYYSNSYLDSVRLIFYKKNEIGKEVFLKGELDSIIVIDSNRLNTYYSEYRQMQYVGQSLFTNKCFGCHNFYPDIVHDLNLVDSLKMNDVNKILVTTHGKIKLNSLETEAIYEYIKPKRDKLMPH